MKKKRKFLLFNFKPPFGLINEWEKKKGEEIFFLLLPLFLSSLLCLSFFLCGHERSSKVVFINHLFFNFIFTSFLLHKKGKHRRRHERYIYIIYICIQKETLPPNTAAVYSCRLCLCADVVVTRGGLRTRCGFCGFARREREERRGQKKGETLKRRRRRRRRRELESQGGTSSTRRE